MVFGGGEEVGEAGRVGRARVAAAAAAVRLEHKGPRAGEPRLDDRPQRRVAAGGQQPARPWAVHDGAVPGQPRGNVLRLIHEPEVRGVEGSRKWRRKVVAEAPRAAAVAQLVGAAAGRRADGHIAVIRKDSIHAARRRRIGDGLQPQRAHRGHRVVKRRHVAVRIAVVAQQHEHDALPCVALLGAAHGVYHFSSVTIE